jgi:hypothetical protein
MGAERFYLQTAADSKVWESVDEYVFKHYAKAVLPTGEKRYSGNRIWTTEGKLNLALTGVDTNDLGIIARFLSVRVDQGTIPGGYVRSPEFVKLAFQQNRVVLHEIGGENFKKTAC